MLKVLWIADLVAPTGFSRVSHSIIKHLDKTKFEVVGLGINYFGDPHPFDFRIYPAKTYYGPYGYERVPEICEREKPDIIFILNDAWIQDIYLEQIKKAYEGKTLPKIVTYTPVDADDHDTAWYKNFGIVSKAVAYNEYGKKIIQKAAPLPMDIIFHGIDTEDFFRINMPVHEIKKKLFGDALEDSFIFLNAGRNQKRKRLDITLRAFKLFAEGKPNNVYIFHHCGNQDQAINVQYLANRLGISDRLIMSEESKKKNGPPNLTTKMLNVLYNATDVGINSGIGEGWSLPNCEHAVTGAPQIVPDHSALHDLYERCGILVPAKMQYVQEGICTTGYVVRDEDLAEKMNLLYSSPALYDSLCIASQKQFRKPEFQWSNIAKQWEKLFEEVM